MNALLYEERRRVFSKKLVFFGAAGSLFSLYNLRRFGRLSPSGRIAAGVGFLYFSGITFASLQESRYLGFI